MVEIANIASNPLRLIFCGTPQFAVPTLQALIAAGHQISLIVTQPDRPVGRKQILTPPPVKQTASAHNFAITQPEKIKNNSDFRVLLESLQPDAIVVVAYGRIIPKWMLDLPRLGCINLHGSLLPKYRGAAPIQWAIANGDEILGNTTMLLEEGLDTGPMLLQQSLPFEPNFTNTAVEALKQLAELGAPLVVQTLEGLANGTIQPQPQDHHQATLAPILTREDGRIEFAHQDSNQIFNRWRAFQPWPGVFTTFHEKKLIITKLKPASIERTLQHGEVRLEDGRFLVGCAADTKLELLEIQPEGRNRMTAAEYLRGAVISAGSRLG